MEWCRLWHDAPDDPKWRLIARKAGVRSGDVWAVFTRMMVRASKASDRGSLDGWDDEVEAIALDFEPEEVKAIREAMVGRVIEHVTPCNANETECNERLSGWGNRQPKRERDDSSAERVRAFREREKAQRTAEKEDVTPCNAEKRLEEIREDTGLKEKNTKKENRAEGTSPRQQRMTAEQRALDMQFERWWLLYPRRVGKGQARKAYQRAASAVPFDDLADGARRYSAAMTGKDPEFIKHPSTWLNGECWLDESAPDHYARSDPDVTKWRARLWLTSKSRWWKPGDPWNPMYGNTPTQGNPNIPKAIYEEWRAAYEKEKAA